MADENDCSKKGVVSSPVCGRSGRVGQAGDGDARAVVGYGSSSAGGQGPSRGDLVSWCRRKRLWIGRQFLFAIERKKGGMICYMVDTEDRFSAPGGWQEKQPLRTSSVRGI